MGVLTDHVASKFFMAKAHEKDALAALKEGVREREESDEYVHDPKGVLAAKNFVAALGATAFVLERNKKGDITSLRWAGDKLPYDTDELQNLFSTFVAWVKKGSFLTIREEDVLCTLTFLGTHVKRKMRGEKDDEARENFENGRRHAEKRRVELAIDCYAAAFAIDGKKRDSFGHRAAQALCELLWAEKRWKELASWCAKLPKEDFAFTSYASNSEDPKAARLLIAAGLKANPRDEECLSWVLEDREKHDDFAKVITAARALKAASKTSAAPALLSEARALYSLGRYPEALRAAQASMKLRPGVSASVKIADCFIAIGKKADALEAVEVALEHQRKADNKPDWGPAVAYESMLLLRLGRISEAEVLLQRAPGLRQETPPFWVPYIRGQLAMAKKDFLVALSFFEEALAGDPKEPWPKLRVFQALHASGTDPARAKKLAAELKKKSPDFLREVKLTLAS